MREDYEGIWGKCKIVGLWIASGFSQIQGSRSLASMHFVSQLTVAQSSRYAWAQLSKGGEPWWRPATSGGGGVSTQCVQDRERNRRARLFLSEHDRFYMNRVPGLNLYP